MELCQKIIIFHTSKNDLECRKHEGIERNKEDCCETFLLLLLFRKLFSTDGSTLYNFVSYLFFQISMKKKKL
jgi:hypothetical protein